MSIKPDCLWDEIALAGKELCRKKQLDYGPHSISNTGNIGVAVRLNDKVTRLLNLIKKFDGAGDKDSANFESVKDTYTDIMNYAVIGLLLMDDKWADKASMEDIFGKCGFSVPQTPAIPDVALFDDEELDWVPHTKLDPVLATLGEPRMGKILPICESSDDDCESLDKPSARQVLVFNDDRHQIEPHKPWHPLFDWSPYIGKYVEIILDSGRKIDRMLYSVGPKRKFINTGGGRISIGSICHIELGNY